MNERTTMKRRHGLLSGLLPGSDEEVQKYGKLIERAESGSTAITTAFQTIDAKAAGILTHVSMMIAGLGLCVPFLAQHRIEEAVIIGEIVVYLMIAVGCLRCLSLFRTIQHVDSPEALERDMRHELVLRHELCRLCIRTSIVFTIIVLISLPLLWWWNPN
ncbi:MAG: hypothetical protein AB7K35_11370 [Pseudorhodoplanes sp.]